MNTDRSKKRSGKSPLFKNAWILSDGKAGDLAQCHGVAQELGVQVDERIVATPKPWVWLMPYGPLPPQHQISRKNSPLQFPLPDLVIAAGWRTLVYVREIKKYQQSSVFTVFLKSPRCRASYLDLIWAPEHDRLSGPRVISSIAGPHRFSLEKLATRFGDKPDYLKQLPEPLTGVLLGGDSKDYHFSDDDCDRFGRSLKSMAEAGAGLAITASRRTPEKLKEVVKQALIGKTYYWWDGDEPNPYGFLISHCDFFITTADSANMVGEPCVSGKPIFVFRPSGGSKKFDRLLASFEAYGATKPLPVETTELIPWRYEPLFAATDIAREIEQRAVRQFSAGV